MATRQRLDRILALWQRVRAGSVPMITQSDRRTSNRAMSNFWGAGGAVVLGTVALGTTRGTLVLGVAGVGVAALLVAASFRIGQDRLPAWLLAPAVAMGSTAVTAIMWFDGSPDSSYKLFYVFASLYACYFLSPRAAILQVLVIAALSALELHLHTPTSTPGAQWLTLMGVVVVAGVWVRHLVDQVRWLANTDGVTGLANRTKLSEDLPRILAHAARSGESITVAMLDLDHFKAYNDRFGHLAGDRHLRETAAAWQAQLRACDLLVRYGGEEFLALLPSCAADAAQRVLERVRQATPNGQSASVGVACWDREESQTRLLARADDALYAAKRQGRNRVVLSEPEETGATPAPQLRTAAAV